jgi:hypothetical protein
MQGSLEFGRRGLGERRHRDACRRGVTPIHLLPAARFVDGPRVLLGRSRVREDDVPVTPVRRQRDSMLRRSCSLSREDPSQNHKCKALQQHTRAIARQSRSLFLTPWLAQYRLARSKGSPGSTARVSRPCIRLMSIEEVTRRLAGSTLHLPSPHSRSSSNRWKLDVSFRQLAGLAEILLFPPASKQTGFAMYPTLILRPRFYRYHLQ